MIDTILSLSHIFDKVVKFVVNDDVRDAFLKAKEVHIAEALGSPVGRRLSLLGWVAEVRTRRFRLVKIGQIDVPDSDKNNYIIFTATKNNHIGKSKSFHCFE